MAKGKVWLVGAGPGDGDLLTRKGERVLQQAEVVVYDSLLGYEILNKIPDTAERIMVGKRAGHHTMPQKEINELLRKKAQEGKKVVRLKGGDPFLFGRGGEELEQLKECDISYEIVPGVTSALAVAAYQGIPVTHREYASSVHIITGHRKQGELLNFDFEALVRADGTLIFLMGVASLTQICEKLIQAGMEKNMPAALLSKGTTCEQRRLVATVETLPEIVQKHPLQKPAILIIGHVCELAETFCWYEKRPLAGIRILVTRPKERQSELAEKLKEQGAEVLEIPTVELQTILTPEQLRLSYKSWKDASVIAFTSPSGVERFFAVMRQAKLDIRLLGTMKIAAIGSATKDALEKKGIFTDLMPEIYEAKALGQCIAEAMGKGTKIFLPHAAGGSTDMRRVLEQNGLHVVELPVYQTNLKKSAKKPDIRKLCEKKKIQWVTFTSASTVRGFVQQTAGMEYTDIQALCIGQKTAQEAKKYGMQTYVAKKATIESMIEEVLKEASKRKGEKNGIDKTSKKITENTSS